MIGSYTIPLTLTTFAAGTLVGLALGKKRVKEAERLDAQLRHHLRGVLAPALLMVEQLSSNPQPNIQRVGHVVENSINQAVILLRTKP